MLFWHGQPDYWSSAGEMYPISRDPPVLPYLKQEEPNGISTSHPPCPPFQYVLCAPTSPAVRHHEETLTYLNQGQSYEIRMMGNPRVDPAGEGRRMMKVRWRWGGCVCPPPKKTWGEALGQSSDLKSQSSPSPAPVQPQFSPGPVPAEPQFSPSSAPVQPQSSPSSPPVQPQLSPSPAPAQPQSSPSPAPVQPQFTPSPAPVQPQFSPSSVLVQSQPSPGLAPAQPQSSPSPGPVHPQSSPSPAPVHPQSSPSSAPAHPQSSPSSPPVQPQSSPSSAPVHPQSSPSPAPVQPQSSPSLRGRGPDPAAQSVVRVVFHDRRLQYSEQQQLEGWRWSRPGDRILDIDIPLSVGILDPQIHPTLLNTVEFLWDPSRRTSVFVQVHCISTEFTLRKNGGEKGVPFRIQIDTFGAGGKGDPPEHLHSASCLVKVFKPKGADRKQKTDREKVEKQPALEREKFQPAYESTVLAECTPWPDVLGAPPSPPSTPGLPSPHTFKLLSPERVCVSPACAAESPAESPGEALSPCASPLETQQWLHKRRFSAYARVFANFAGADLLKLSRRDLIQICGAPDGIRLCNALTGRCLRPRLTLYVSREPAGGAEGAGEGCSGLYQELHLEELTVAELSGKLAELLGLPVAQILRVSRQGPSGIHILVSDAMIRNLLDETCFVVAISKAQGPEGYDLVLR
ncbi:transcription factor CP2-like protein 1 isoform X5 [Strix uralensis]|uniref:transcription factor CP2-like protein 1 isoform X5 n=1 Tax=Strix uralensis TaxID=36305 RepID=UPI003DA725E1